MCGSPIHAPTVYYCGANRRTHDATAHRAIDTVAERGHGNLQVHGQSTGYSILVSLYESRNDMGGWAGGREYYTPKDERREHANG